MEQTYFAADWVIDDEGVINLTEVFDIAHSLTIEISLSFGKTLEGFNFITFVFHSQLDSHSHEFLTRIKGKIHLINWHAVSAKDFIGVAHGPKSLPTNLNSKWFAGLLNLAQENQQLHAQLRSGSDCSL
jgi:hypothetical protein